MVNESSDRDISEFVRSPFCHMLDGVHSLTAFSISLGVHICFSLGQVIHQSSESVVIIQFKKQLRGSINDIHAHDDVGRLREFLN